jgi:hypothetical protein
LTYFSKCIIEGLNPEPNGAEGLADVRVINALMESATKAKPVEIGLAGKKQRPSIDQEIHTPPLDKQDVARAHSRSQ